MFQTVVSQDLQCADRAGFLMLICSYCFCWFLLDSTSTRAVAAVAGGGGGGGYT